MTLIKLGILTLSPKIGHIFIFHFESCQIAPSLLRQINVNILTLNSKIKTVTPKSLLLYSTWHFNIKSKNQSYSSFILNFIKIFYINQKIKTTKNQKFYFNQLRRFNIKSKNWNLHTKTFVTLLNLTFYHEVQKSAIIIFHRGPTLETHSC